MSVWRQWECNSNNSLLPLTTSETIRRCETTYWTFCFYYIIILYTTCSPHGVNLYTIWQRPHDRQLSIISGQLRNRNFINRMLFKDCYWLCHIFTCTCIILMHILATILWLLLSAAFIYLYSCRCVLSSCLINEHDDGEYRQCFTILIFSISALFYWSKFSHVLN